MDFGLCCVAVLRPGQAEYSAPLARGQAEIYEDGIRRVYEFDMLDLEKFHDWARRVFIDAARHGPIDLEISQDSLTLNVITIDE